MEIRALPDASSKARVRAPIAATLQGRGYCLPLRRAFLWEFCVVSKRVSMPGFIKPQLATLKALGERRRLILANKAIIAYQRFRAEQRTLAASLGTRSSFPR